MTEKQKTIYLIIEEHWKRFGYGPSIDDIMDQTGDRGRGNVHRTIKALVEMGACKQVKNRARSVRPIHIRFRDIQ